LPLVGLGTGRSTVNELGAETLQRLLQTYKSALAELRDSGDPAVRPLIDDLARLQAEAVAALAGMRAGVGRNGGG
jgi:hypothetical protein